MKSYKVTVDGKTFNVDVQELGSESSSSDEPLKVRQSQDVLKETPNANLSEGGTEVLAPMPGVILDIKAKVGDMVKAGDTIVVLEAMKMENDIVAPCDGKLNSVVVKKGESVNSNDILATIV